MYDEDYTYEKPLVRDAVEALVERYRDEYDVLVRGTQANRIAELEDQVRRKEIAIQECRERLARYGADRERWRQRVASGVTELVTPAPKSRKRKATP